MKRMRVAQTFAPPFALPAFAAFGTFPLLPVGNGAGVFLLVVVLVDFGELVLPLAFAGGEEPVGFGPGGGFVAPGVSVSPVGLAGVVTSGLFGVSVGVGFGVFGVLGVGFGLFGGLEGTDLVMVSFPVSEVT